MTTIELIADVSSDHRLTTDVPASCPPGRHRLLLFIDSPCESVMPDHSVPSNAETALAEAATETRSPEDCLEWRNGLLVYTGELVEPIGDLVAWDREQRMRDLWGMNAK